MFWTLVLKTCLPFSHFNSYTTLRVRCYDKSHFRDKGTEVPGGVAEIVNIPAIDLLPMVPAPLV